MLARKQEINLKVSQLLDAALLALAFVISYALRARFTDFPLFSGVEVPSISRLNWLAIIIAPCTPPILEFFGYYDHPLQKRPWPWVSIGQMFKALIIIGVIIGGVVIFAQKTAESRAVLAVYAIVGGIMLLAKEAAIRWYVRRKYDRLGIRERVLFAGTPEDVRRLVESLPQTQLSEMEIVGRLDIERQPIADLVKALHEQSVERVIFAASHAHFDRLQAAINACEIEGVEAWLWTDFLKTAIARPTFDVLGGKPMLVFRSTPDASWELLLKDVLDRLGGLTILFCSLPLWIVAWIGIKWQSPGPAFFRQQRSGKNGKPFTMWKFRTMNLDAEERKKDLQAHNQMTGPVFKIDKDPRIFPFGAWLRKTSIDEFPQLINVVRGEMSLVGPRPLPVYEVEKIEEAAQRRRLSVKPGLTCLWQVSGRNRITDFQEWVQLDLQYIDNWSLWLDLVILFRTIPAVLFRSGAK